MRMRALLALSLIVALFLVAGGPVAAGSNPVVEEIHDAKHDAMADIDEVVGQFVQDVFDATDQTERDALLEDALEEVDGFCKEGVDEINAIVGDHPEEQSAADQAIAYLENYTHAAENMLVAEHGEASEGASTTTTSIATVETWIEITTPITGDEFDNPTVQFKGKATPGAQVTVGPFNAATGPNGGWTITLVLNEGRNVARVTATTEYGTATDQVVVFYLPATTTTSSTTSTTSTTTTTTVPATTTTTTTTTVVAAGPSSSPSGGGPAIEQVEVEAAFARLLEGRTAAIAVEVSALEASSLSMSGGPMTVSEEAFAVIRPVVPYALEQPVYSIFAVIEMIGQALTASVRNLIGPAIVTLGYLVVSMVRRRRSIVA